MLGDAFEGLGDYQAAERELRAALAMRTQDPAATQFDLAALECSLGTILVQLGRYEEAEALLLRAEARLAEQPGAARVLFAVYTALTNMYGETGRYDRIERTLARQLETASDARERLGARNSRAALLVAQGKTTAALAEFDAILTDTIAARGEESMDVGVLLVNRGGCRARLGDLAGAEEDLRRALAVRTRVFGPAHGATASVMAQLAEILVKAEKSLPEAEDLARRSVALSRAAADDSLDLAWNLECLAVVLTLRSACADAAPYALEALALIERHLGRDENWAQCAPHAVTALGCSGRLDEAEQLLDQLASHSSGPTPRRLLWFRAGIERRRGNLEAALELYDEAIALGSADPRDRETLREPFPDLAALLRELGDEAGALELERQAAELPQ
jgi:tetratricopeptide (TPR) repeat protein